MLNNLKAITDQHADSQNIIWRLLIYLKFLCWKLKAKLTWKFFSLPSSIFDTKPYGCNPDAKVEVHTLIGHKYLKAYLLSAKSLLRYYNNIALIIHDDKTLTSDDKNILHKHILGIKIIDANFADEQVEKILGNREKSIAARKANVVSKELFDYALLSGTNKVITLDSDTIFLSYPFELIAWIKDENNEILFNYEIFSFQQDSIIKKLGYDYQPYFNLGFCCFYKGIIDLDSIEEIISKTKDIHYCTFQYIFSILLKQASAEYKISYFNPKEYQVLTSFKPNQPIFRHYLSQSGLNSYYMNDAKKVIKEL